MRLWLLWTMILVVSPSLGQVQGAYVPGPFQQMPEYWSGTLNAASGAAYALPPPQLGGEVWMVEAYLYVGPYVPTELVKEWHWTPDQMTEPFIVLGCLLDSTHFPNGSPLCVKIRAIDNYGRLYEATESAQVKNNALLGNHSFANFIGISPSGSQSSQTVQNHLGTNWTATWRTHGGLTLSSWRSRIGGSNFI